ncbi:MAG TPA: hypothetical protein VMV37_01540 [Gammaproteobacteria bacterium]|nr:hypothetical protein [Gammaproteobacteria bacterium]
MTTWTDQASEALGGAIGHLATALLTMLLAWLGYKFKALVKRIETSVSSLERVPQIEAAQNELAKRYDQHLVQYHVHSAPRAPSPSSPA